ncbi:hypothetical protein M406DRAFT_74863 [Cryphonectria parasitica EP155]|uniref:Vacuolar protein sorting-associated protein 62 n=1 Tax=Cryphonectria parasitica (strain ATCC 38755 / EP155) TaxID=660469 RepID=A0A9P4XWN2_CRYP1|nr:uncharacterized protein M406DRAFT_74863 [Cryphonectria parasitica EP155]KAF3761940.1 hypothetical protein M406DRAFT_74863 [Cryphonectria parasitica EP155]
MKLNTGTVLLHLSSLLLQPSLTSAAPGQKRRTLQKREALPDYAITYAPWSYLYSAEGTFPSDITVHLNNTIPEENYVALGAVGSVTVDTLDSYASDVYLTSADNIADDPAWLLSDYGIPDAVGYSAAPGLIIAAEKNASTTDVFYFYFYSYNYGRPVLDIEFDLHVGDWEHAMIRFIDSEPYAIYLSEHSAGSAYYWDVMDFTGDRPITYIANGSHANYATAGSQDYTIALGIVTDVTDAGYAWDMTQNYRGYWYDTTTNTFTTASGNSTGATEEADEDASWLSWEGYWGDEQYADGDDGQYCLFGECLYTSGPTGPVTKNLGRTTMCEDDSDCTIFDNINDLTVQSKKARKQ